MGIDSSHPAPGNGHRPSMIGVVWSTDPLLTRYCAAILPQVPRVEILSRRDMAILTKVRIILLRYIILKVGLASDLKLQGSKKVGSCADCCVSVSREPQRRFLLSTLDAGMAFLKGNCHVRNRKKLKASEVRNICLTFVPPFISFDRWCC